MKLKYDFCFQPIGTDYLAVAVGDKAKDFHSMVQLNETAKFIMSQMQEEISLDGLVQKVLDEYEINEADARAHILEVIDYLKKEEVLDA